MAMYAKIREQLKSRAGQWSVRDFIFLEFPMKAHQEVCLGVLLPSDGLAKVNAHGRSTDAQLAMPRRGMTYCSTQARLASYRSGMACLGLNAGPASSRSGMV